MRLIDADAFKAEGRKLYREAGWDLREVHYSQLDTECNIDMIPTIEAEPVKHGRWIKSKKSDYNWECSNCGYGLTDYRTTYCYDCGAKMDEQQEVE